MSEAMYSSVLGGTAITTQGAGLKKQKTINKIEDNYASNPKTQNEKLPNKSNTGSETQNG